MPKVSIIVPVYNAAKFLDGCLLSLTNQSYTNIEIVLVNDGSTDDSPRICDSWAKKDDRVKVVHQKNSGVSAARNTAILNSTGELISMIDADDTIEIDTISSAVAYFNDNVDIVSFGYRIISGKNVSEVVTKHFSCTASEITDEQNFKDFYLTWNAFIVWNKVFRRSFLLENELSFEVGVKIGEDSDYMIRCLLKNPYIVTIDKVFYNYIKVVSDNATAKFYDDLEERQFDIYKIRNEFFEKMQYDFRYDIEGEVIIKDAAVIKFYSLNNVNLDYNFSQHYRAICSLIKNDTKLKGVLEVTSKSSAAMGLWSSRVTHTLLKLKAGFLLTIFIRLKSMLIKMAMK